MLYIGLLLHRLSANVSTSSQFSQEAKQEYIHTKATHGEEIPPEESDSKCTRPPLKDFVGLREQMHVEDGGQHITSKHRRSCMPDSYRPSLAELLEESILAALTRNEQQHHAIADDSKDTTDDAPNLNEPSTLNDSLLASLSSINNNIFRPRRNSPPITLPSSAYDSSSASGTDSGTDSELEVDSDDYYDPDPQDVLGPCIASPVIPSSPKFNSCTTATKMANARGGKATARTPYPLLSSGAALLRPPPHPRVFAVKNDIEYGRRKACGVRLWRGNKSSLGMEVAV